MNDEMHYLFFDGSKYFVGDHDMLIEDVDEKLELIYQSFDLDKLARMADKHNDNLF